MRHKLAVCWITISLLASAPVCFGKESKQPAAFAAPTMSPEQPLSYNGQVAISIAQEHIEKKEFKEALKYADKAVAADSKSGLPHMLKAFILESLGDTKKATHSYTRAVALSPRNGFVLNAYATHLCGLKQYQQADATYALAASDKNYPQAYLAFENAARCAYASKNFELAEKRARATLAMNPTSVSALVVMTEIKFKDSEFMEARAFISRLEALGPLNAPLLKLGQQIEKAAGDDRAAAQYQKKLDIVLQHQIQPPTGEGQKKP